MGNNSTGQRGPRERDEAGKGQENAPAGTLYLVALPIGNARDITFRAVDVLRAVDLIAAEDTRDFRVIARAHDIDTRVVSYHDFNEQSRAPELIELVREDAEALDAVAEVEGLRGILVRGSSAHRQIEVHARALQAGLTEEEALRSVAAWLVEETART